MAAGDVLKEGLLVIEEFTVRADEDIEEGEVVFNGIILVVGTIVGAIWGRQNG